MLFIMYLLQISCKTACVLINTSKNFFNYRHMSNIHAMHYLMQSIGFSSTDIHVVGQEDLFRDPRNILKDGVHFTESIVVPHIPLDPSPISEQYILNLFYLRHPALYKLDKFDNAIIYMCGHAREGFFKVSDRYFIFRADLTRAVRVLSERLSRVLIILDTCQASSLVDNELPNNVCVVTTSSHTEFSFSDSSLRLLSAPGIDEAVLLMYKRGIVKNITVSEYFNGLNDGSLKSHINCYGNLEFKFSDFLNMAYANAMSKYEL